MLVAIIGKQFDGFAERQPNRFVCGFRRHPHACDRARNEDVADLFRPDVIFRHEHKPPENAHLSGSRDMPAGFLEHFAMQCRDRRFTRIDAATGQLYFWVRFALMRDEELTPVRQQGIRAGTSCVLSAVQRRLSETSDHCLALSNPASCAYIPAVCQDKAFKEIP